MKTPQQISKICGTTWEIVYRAIQRLNIVPVHKKGRICYYDEFQFELIVDHLFYACKIDSLIFESSMNKKELPDYEAFRKFKLETYGKIN